MAQGRSTKIISMIKWIRTSGLSIKKSFSLRPSGKHLQGTGDASYVLTNYQLEITANQVIFSSRQKQSGDELFSHSSVAAVDLRV